MLYFLKNYPEIAGFLVALMLLGTLSNYRSILRRLKVYLYAWLYFFLAKDSAFTVGDVRPLNPADFSQVQTKKLVFIRHGESTWNAIFNIKPLWTVPFRLLRAIVLEGALCMNLPLGMLLGGRVKGMLDQIDSFFIDAPLNENGLLQAKGAREWVETCQTHVCQMLTGTGDALKKSVLVSSPLRRAVSTMIVVLHRRLSTTLSANNQIYILSDLQEISRNIDTQSILPPHSIPQLSASEQSCEDAWVKQALTSYSKPIFDTSNFTGTKGLDSNGKIRIMRFLSWVFQNAENTDKEIIIVAGHSLYFQKFFKLFLEASDQSELGRLAQTRKIKNGGIVSFDITAYGEGTFTTEYRIHSDSLEVHHLGFEV